MKKFFVPLFLVLLFSCSSIEDFKPSEQAASEQKNNRCYVERNHKYYDNISESLCVEMGGEPGKFCPVEVCGEGEISSSSRNTASSSSRGSSSSRVGSSSSRIGSSSSNDDGDDSSSSGDDDSSSSIVAVSSSSVGAGSSSSSSAVSSSSIGNSSSSSVGNSSSSSLGPPDIDITTACASFPYYVAKTKKEPIKNLFLESNTTGCEKISYSASGSASISGDSISFASYTVSTTAEQKPIITASVECGSKTYSAKCPITVVVAADSLKEARCNHESIFGKFNITKATTILNYACCEPQKESEGYFITCNNANYSLKINGSPSPTITPDNGNGKTNLPVINPMIPEPYAQCKKYGDPVSGSPGGILYRYPKRILMTVTGTLGSGGFLCESW